MYGTNTYGSVEYGGITTIDGTSSVYIAVSSLIIPINIKSDKPLTIDIKQQ